MYLISKNPKSRVTNLLTFQRNSSFHLPHFEKNDSFICFMSKDSFPWFKFTEFERTLSSYFKKSLGPMYLILKKKHHFIDFQSKIFIPSFQKKSFFHLPHLPHFKQSHYFIYFRGDFEEIRTSVYLISKKLFLPITSSHRTWDVELDSFIGLTESFQRTLFPHFKQHPEVPRFQKNHVSICLILQVRAFNYSSSPYFRRTRHSEVPHFKELHSFIATKKDFQISQKFMNSIYLSSKNCIPSKQKDTLR